MTTINTPITIKHLNLKNRLVLPPMATAKAQNGKVTKELCDYYNEKSTGGYIGLIIMEHLYINIDGKASAHQLSIASDEDIIGLKKVVDIVHNNSTPIFAQINHAGSKSITTKYSASKIQHPQAKENEVLPKEMSQVEIDKVIQDFVVAALRAKKAGFDGIEIHGAHGYLLNQFYSPITNKRKDQYGSNKIKLHQDIIKAIRKKVGNDFLIALRLGACDYIEGGNTLAEAIPACIAFEQAGIDILDISGGLNGYIRPGYTEEGYFKDVTFNIKKHVSIPVILTGGIKSYDTVNILLRENSADLIGVGREIFKDSSWAKNCIEHNK